MKDDVILKVENLSKQYRLGTIGTGTISHDLNRWWAKVRGKEDPYLKIGESNDRASKGNSQYVWALKDINFKVKRGEVLGIIGKNGAGKSTLLKILSQVTGPTTGSIKSKGRIASLLEVGTGFHPEMTGRENIFLNGAILGMTKAEIRSKLDEIINFSGCERYIDTPVKRYSSGMKVRLAFAVAAHLEPDILVVDEVLAVGDAEFQKKAIGKMQDISKGDGRTVLFVSHDMGAVKNLCNRAILINKGKIESIGAVNTIVKSYLTSSKKRSEQKLLTRTDRDGNGKLLVSSVNFINAEGNNVNSILIGEKLIIEVGFQEMSDFNYADFVIAINFMNDLDNFILSYVSDEMNIDFTEVKKNKKIKLVIPELNLRSSTYSLRILLAERGDRVDRIDNVAQLEVINKDIWNSGRVSRKGNEPFLNAFFTS